MIKAIVFDFYGVFLEDPYDAWLRANNLVREGVYSRLSENLDAGHISHDEFYDLLSTESKVPAEKIKEAFSERGVVDPLAKRLLSQLSQHSYRIGLISNGSDHVRKHLENANLIEYFNSVTLSSEVGLIKPHPEIFIHSFKTLGVSAQDTLYIDDRIENVDTAKYLGATGIVFHSLNHLREDLQQRNLL